MVHYDIKQYTFDQAKKYGYIVKVAQNKKKKLDVYKDNVKIASLGNSQHAKTNGHIEITNGFLHLAITKLVRIT